MRVVRVTAHGSPEDLKMAESLLSKPAGVQIAAAGGNIIDIGVRTGMTWLDLTPPFALGVEGARDLNLWRFRPRIQAPGCSGTGAKGYVCLAGER
jgi:hypothetical protein